MVLLLSGVLCVRKTVSWPPHPITRPTKQIPYLKQKYPFVLQALLWVSIMSDLELDLEQELLQELEKFDSMFAEHEEEEGQLQLHDLSLSQNQSQSQSRLSRGTLSAYELAVAESEKEELQDRLRVLLSKTEDFDQQLRDLTAENLALRCANDQLYHENRHLKLSLTEYEKIQQQQHFQSNGLNGGTAIQHIELEDFRLLEFKLAETRSKLARTQQLNEDLHLAKEQALRELDQERLTRIHIEKERDAYSAAYEASLQHFERWTKAKVKNAQPS